MEESNLNKRIKKISYSIFAFFFCFLVIGFFLKSNYPIYKYAFNTKDAYDVITDGLTLSAYFLAPAIAYILFTDWRDQHRRINNERVSSEIVELLSQVLPFLNTPAISLSSNEEYLKYRKKYFGLLIDLKRKNELINPNCLESSEFISKINDLSDLMHDFWLKLETQIIIHNEVDFIKDLGPEYNDMRHHYRKSIQVALNENSSTFANFMRIREEIKILYV